MLPPALSVRGAFLSINVESRRLHIILRYAMIIQSKNFRGKEVKQLDGLTLMIVDSSEDFRLALEKELAGTHRLIVCQDGRQALEEAPRVQPDLIIMDLMLTEVDGVTLLHELHQLGLHPMVLAVTRFFNAYIQEAAQELGIVYIIRKPCSLAAVRERVRDLCKLLASNAPRLVDPVAFVSQRIKFLLFSPRHNGSAYLKEAVLMMWRQPGISLTKELYPGVGAMFGSSAPQVERSIRSAIQSAWNQRSPQDWGKLFPTGPNEISRRPSNGAVISRLADDLREALSRGLRE